MADYSSRIREEPIDRDQGRDTREQRKQRVVRHARCIGEDTVFRYAFVDAPENILPSARRNLGLAFIEAAPPVVELCVYGSTRVLFCWLPGETSSNQQGAQTDGPERFPLGGRQSFGRSRVHLNGVHALLPSTAAAPSLSLCIAS